MRYSILVNVVLVLGIFMGACEPVATVTEAATAAPEATAPAEPAALTSELPYVDHQVIVVFLYNHEGNGFSRDDALVFIENEGLDILEEFELAGPFPDEAGNTVADAVGAFLTEIGEAVEEVVNRINANYPETQVNAGPNFLLELHIQPNDINYAAGDQWGLQNTGQIIQGVNCKFDIDIDAPPMWTIRTSNSGVPLAIVDSGIGPHADLPPWPAAFPVPDPDPNGHGTAVAGVAGALTNNANEVAGVVWGASRLDYSHSYNIWGLSKSIAFAVLAGAKVINISAGTKLKVPTTPRQHVSMFVAILFADLSNVLVVVSAGNDGVDLDIPGNEIYPASYNAGFTWLRFRPLQNLLVATSVDCSGNGARMIGHNWGINTVDLEAPGKDILRLRLNAAPIFRSGTSYAAPHVSGVAALIRAEDPTLSDDQVKQIILDTVTIMGRAPQETRTDGMLNGFRALYRTAGWLSLIKYAALVEFYVDELLRGIDNLRNTNEDLQDVLEDAPFGPYFTPDIQQSAIAELEFLRGQSDVSEGDIPETLIALQALRDDLAQTAYMDREDLLSSAITISREVDHYRFGGMEGEVIVIDLDANVWQAGWDPVLRLYDAGGNELFFSDDVDGKDPRLEVSLPYNGDYVFSIEELNRDEGNVAYTYDVKLRPGLYPISEAVPYYDSTSAGVIDSLGNWDNVTMEASAGDILVANVDARILGSNLDSELKLFGPDGALIALSDDSDATDSWLEVALPASGIYMVTVGEHGDDYFGSNFTYQLNVRLYHP